VAYSTITKVSSSTLWTIVPHRTAVLVLYKRGLSGLIECKETQSFKTKSKEESLGNLGITRIMNYLRFFTTSSLLHLKSNSSVSNTRTQLCRPAVSHKLSLPWSSRSSLRQPWCPSLRLLPSPAFPARGSITVSSLPGLSGSTVGKGRYHRIYVEVVG
jgi:hypothetical protein